MKIVYYYVLYLKALKKKEEIEIHLKPFNSEIEAKNYKEETDKHFGDRVYSSKIKKVNLSKFEKGLWL